MVNKLTLGLERMQKGRTPQARWGNGLDSLQFSKKVAIAFFGCVSGGYSVVPSFLSFRKCLAIQFPQESQITSEVKVIAEDGHNSFPRSRSQKHKSKPTLRQLTP